MADYPIFRNYLEDEDDKPYFHMNTLAFYYEDMERKQKLIEDLARKIVGYDLKITGNLEEVEKEVAAKLAAFDDKIDTLPASVNDLLDSWVADGSIKSIIDTTIVDEKIAPLTAQLAEKASYTTTWGMANMGQDVKEALTGGSVAVVGANAVDTVNIIDGKVTGEKTNFLNSKGNVFNKNSEIFVGGYHNSTTGTWKTAANLNTIIVPIKPNTTYANNLPKNALSFFTGNMIFVSGVEAGSWSTLNVPNDAKIQFVSVPFPPTANLNTYMLVEGETLPASYIPYGFVMNELVDLNEDQVNAIKAGAVQDSDIKVEIISRNRFGKTNLITGKEVYTDGTIRNQSQSAVTGYIPLVENIQNIYVSGLTAYIGGFSRHLWFYNEAFEPIGSLQSIAKEEKEKGFTVPVGAKYVNLSVYQRKTSDEPVNLDNIQIEMGASKTLFTEYTEGIVELKSKKLIAVNPNEPEPKTKDANMLIFGDSITETATMNEDGSGYSEGYRSNWMTFARENLNPGQVWNFARSGASYKDQNVQGDVRKSISSQINLAISGNKPADVIVVAAGVNDGSSSIGDYTTAMSKSSLEELDRSKLYEAIRWAFWTLRLKYPDAVCFASTPIQRASNDHPEPLIEAITKMAKRYNFILIDAHNESGIVRDFEVHNSAGRFLSDGLHPNLAGRQKIANLFSRVITNSLTY